MKIGIDFGVYSQHPDKFAEITSALIDGGIEVYLVAISSDRDGERLLRQTQSFAIPHTVISLMSFDREEDVPQDVLEYCVEYGLNLFLSDREDVCQLLRKNGIISLLEISPK